LNDKIMICAIFTPHSFLFVTKKTCEIIKK
jgi:hypothetical protein